VFLSTLELKAFDVKALRAFRVLRPLKLVSGVPSEYTAAVSMTTAVSAAELPHAVAINSAAVWESPDESATAMR
jgi:hypothetical protein